MKHYLVLWLAAVGLSQAQDVRRFRQLGGGTLRGVIKDHRDENTEVEAQLVDLGANDKSETEETHAEDNGDASWWNEFHSQASMSISTRQPTPRPTKAPTPRPTGHPTVPVTFGSLVSGNLPLVGFTDLTEATDVATALDDPARGPFTVFAPPTASLVQTLTRPYFDKLQTEPYNLHTTSFTQFHIATGELQSDELVNGTTITMSNGLIIEVNVEGTTKQLVTSSVLFGLQEPINIIEADQSTSNGVLHLVDAPLLPFWYFFDPSTALLALPDTFSAFGSLIEAAQLSREIASLVDSTLCAPNNLAMASVPKETMDFLLDPINKVYLEEVILYHVIVDLLSFTQLDYGTSKYDTLQRDDVAVRVRESSSGGKLLRFNAAKGVGAGFYLTKEDIIYEIDRLLIPPSLVDAIPNSEVALTEVSTAVAFGALNALDEATDAPGSNLISESGFIAFSEAPTESMVPSQ